LPDPWERMSLRWPQPKRPILSYEAERPISAYPIIGISVAYELELSGLIRLLEGAGIPLLAAQRGPRDPIIIGGGPLTNSNPSSLLPFVDLLIAGEAEALLPQAVERILDIRTRRPAIDAVADELGASSAQVAAAVAAFGMKLRDSQYVKDFDLEALLALARESQGADELGYRSELMDLIELARPLLKPDDTQR